jgi:carbamoyltransferase
MYTLGISAFYHDSAACLINDESIIFAAQEERFTRIRHDEGFPHQAIQACLHAANIHISDIDNIIFYDKPFLKFDRIFETYLQFAPKGFKSFAKSLPIWVKDKLFQKKLILTELNKISPETNFDQKLKFSEHHFSHAASAFYPSPFKKAAILTMDGVGEWVTTSLAIGDDNKITPIKEINFPHSLGLLYSAITYYTGFKVNSGEYKVMGLAPYGSPIYAHLIKENLIDIKDDGSFRLNMEYFDYCTNLKMTNSKFDRLFGGPPRKPESQVTQKEMDMAASIQSVVEEVIIKLAKSIKKETGLDNLCLAGGVALNCVANGKLHAAMIFKNIWIQPASGDAGGALGAALAFYYMNGNRRTIMKNDSMSGSFLGTSYNDNEIEKSLQKEGAKFIKLDDKSLIEKLSTDLKNGKIVGWHQGRMEFGPRSLGSRSIIADPRSPKAQKDINLKIKFRESFRPFAPAVLAEKVSEWFDFKGVSPYMLMVANVKSNIQKKLTEAEKKLFGIDKLNIPRSSIPAVTHVDYSARIQTVHKETNPKFHKLLTAFYKKTKCPVLVNTSFNVRGEPIVMTPADSFKCFMGTDLDILVIGNYYLEKKSQNKKLAIDYKNKYELD